MTELQELAKLIQKRNLLECEITTLIGRPAALGHIGEFIASKIFHIALQESASHKSIDGYFIEGDLKGKSVDIKWYARLEGILDISKDLLPDYYLVMTGPKSAPLSSRGQSRPWAIDYVFLFDASALVEELKRARVKIGVATSIRQQFWAKAEIHPNPLNKILQLSTEQHEAINLFSTLSVSGQDD